MKKMLLQVSTFTAIYSLAVNSVFPQEADVLVSQKTAEDYNFIKRYEIDSFLSDLQNKRSDLLGSPGISGIQIRGTGDSNRPTPICNYNTQTGELDCPTLNANERSGILDGSAFKRTPWK